MGSGSSTRNHPPESLGPPDRTIRIVALIVAILGASISGCIRAPRGSSNQPGLEPPPIEAGIVPSPGPYAPGFDAVHYEISLSLPDSGSYIEGRTVAAIVVQENPPAAVPLDLTGIAVQEVTVDGSPTPFRLDAGKLYVDLPGSTAAGDTLRIAVVYSGTPDDGLILGHNIHGAPTAFADNWPNRARFWFPSIDHPSDKATVDIDVRLDPDSEKGVIANGRLLESSDGRFRWSTTRPIPTYTVVIGAADFAVSRLGEACAGGACTEVTTWLFPPDSAHGGESFRRAVEMVRFYSELIAPFPYEKLAHVQSSTRFGGMENVSAIFYSEQSIAQGNDIEPTVAHETAHQWFGDSVTQADWHHLWLSEGFATYFGALFFAHADGIERFREMMRSSREQYIHSGSAGSPIITSSVDNLFELLNANNYNKGGWVLHMLRRRVGDDAFFRGIRTYYDRHQHANALTDDFRAAMEEVSGEELGDFFDQWVFSPGHPRFRISWSPAVGGANLTIEQVQPAAWPEFDVPLELSFTTEDGPVSRQIRVDARAQEFHVELPATPTAVDVDPNVNLLHEIVSVEEIG